MWRRLQSRSSNAHAVQRRAEYGRILQRSGRKYDFDAAKPLAAGQEISWSSNVRRVLSSEVLDEPQNSRTERFENQRPMDRRAADPGVRELKTPQPQKRLDRSTTADQPGHEQHQRYDQQDVDEITQRVATHETQQPQHKQNHRDSEQHSSLLDQYRAQVVPTRFAGRAPDFRSSSAYLYVRAYVLTGSNGLG